MSADADDTNLLREAALALSGCAPLPPANSINVGEIDSGQALQRLLFQYTARIQQLKESQSHMLKETDSILDSYLMQNLELINLNQSLEHKVKERTRQLEVANENLEAQKLQLQQLSATKEALSHMIVHDLKNPLTAVLSTLTLFTRQSFQLQPEIHQLLLGAHLQGKRMLSMIEEILLVSRMQTQEFKVKLQPLDLRPILSQCCDLMRQTIGDKPLGLTLELPSGELPLAVDAELLERVVNNLINNAIKYAFEHTEIVVRARREPAAYRIEVINQGNPIPINAQEKMFELFARVNPQDAQFSGTGLGLAFCRLAVEAHHGTINVQSPLPGQDKGTCLYLTLPITQLP